MQLHHELLALRKKEIQIGKNIIEKLQLMEEGRKYLRLGYSSMFDYLVRGLGYSESSAYQKQSCVRLSQEIPDIKEKIDSGVLSVTGIGYAFKSLKNKSVSEKRGLLKNLENKSTREIKKILVQYDTAPSIKIQKTEYQDKVVLRLKLSKAQNKKLEKLKALKSHKGDMAHLIEALIDQELKKYEKIHYKATTSKNPRFVSKRLRNAVLKQAGHKCEYPNCQETHYLQVDHILPVRLGGTASLKNLQVLCGAHNRMKG